MGIGCLQAIGPKLCWLYEQKVIDFSLDSVLWLLETLQLEIVRFEIV